MAVMRLFRSSSEPAAPTKIQQVQQRLDETVKRVEGTGELSKRLEDAYGEFAAALRGERA